MKFLYLLPVVSLSLLANGAFAAQVGLGVSFKSNDANIYAPINLSPTFRLEPFLGYSKSETGDDESTNSNEFSEIGLGIFGLSKAADKIDLYYGARLSWAESDYKNEQNSNDTDYHSSTKQKLDGYGIAPTIGFEYQVIPAFVVGAEASLEHYNLDGKYTHDTNQDFFSNDYSYKVESKRTTTETRVLFRYFF